MPILKNIGFLATCKAEGHQGEIHPIRNGAIVWEGQKILWVGAEASLPEPYRKIESWDAKGNLVTPGLIDCHTHLAFGGWRANEFTLRALGKTYEEIAREGGGIINTVKATRETTYEELLVRCRFFISQMVKLGITTIQCKSGYGLDVENELKVLKVYKELCSSEKAGIISSFLGAHIIPREFKDNREGYIRLLCEKLLPEIRTQNLAQFCDIFVDDGAFTVKEARTIFHAAKEHGLKLELHADQFSRSGGAELAAEVGALSAAHLECISEEGIGRMAEAGVVGVLLPLATLYTQKTPLNARKLINGGVRVSVATDFNPGSAPSYNLPLAMMLACNLNRMAPSEVLKGVTAYAAKALNLESSVGSLEPGKLADFAVFESPDVDHWLYHFRPNACVMTVKGGEKIA